MVRVFKKILRDRRRDRRLRWDDDLRLRRRLHETEEPPAILDEQRDERGGSSSLFARADGGAAADSFRLAPSRGGAAPNKAGR
jgi:hypothetical protein